MPGLLLPRIQFWKDNHLVLPWTISTRNGERRDSCEPGILLRATVIDHPYRAVVSYMHMPNLAILSLDIVGILSSKAAQIFYILVGLLRRLLRRS